MVQKARKQGVYCGVGVPSASLVWAQRVRVRVGALLCRSSPDSWHGLGQGWGWVRVGNGYG